MRKSYGEDSKSTPLDKQKEWEQTLPCATCELTNICRYANVVKRIDYPKDVFNISITCKLQKEYKVVKNE